MNGGVTLFQQKRTTHMMKLEKGNQVFQKQDQLLKLPFMVIM